MTADTYGSILGLIQQGTGNNNNTWGTTFNGSFATPGERAVAGVNTITAVGGTVDLSTVVPPAGLRLDVDFIQRATATLTSDLTVKVTNISKSWWFQNDTAGAFNMFVQVPSGTSPNGLIQIPQGCGVMVICDGSGNLRRHDRSLIGTLVHHGGGAVPAGTLWCNGASLLRAEYPDLYSAIGTTWGVTDSTHFTLPNFIDTSRFMRAANSGSSSTAATNGATSTSSNILHFASTPGFIASGMTVYDLTTNQPIGTVSSTTGTTVVLSANASNAVGSGDTLSFTASGSISAGTYQSNQNLLHHHTVSGTGTISGSTDTQGAHTHTTSDPGHVHTFPGSVLYQPSGGASPNFSSSGSGGYANPGTSSAVTGISINSAGAHAHAVSGSCSISLTTVDQGGAEARPEAAAVLICIRY